MLESVESITFNGHKLTETGGDVNSPNNYFIINEVRGRGVHSNDVEVETVPGSRDFESSRRLRTRELEVDITVKGVSFPDLRDRLERLSEILQTNGDVPIEFADEPNRTYYGRFVESEESLEKSMIAQLTLHFSCYDQFKYGETYSDPMFSNSFIGVEGTAGADAIFDLDVTDDISLIEIENTSNKTADGENRSIVLGEDQEIEEEPVMTNQLVLHDTMSSTDGWTEAPDVDNGYVSGKIGVDRDGFYVEEWGDEDLSDELQEIAEDIKKQKESLQREIETLKNERDRLRDREDKDKKDRQRIKEIGKEISSIQKEIKDLNKEKKEREKDVQGDDGAVWIGPSLKRDFEEPLESFQADIYVSNQNYEDNNGDRLSKGTIGIMEAYLRDVNGELIAKIAFGDNNTSRPLNSGMLQVAGERHQMRPDNLSNWYDFDGVMRIERDTSYYYPYIARIDENGNHINVVEYGRVIPGPGVAENEVKTIQVAMRKWKGYSRNIMRIKEVKVTSFIGMYEYPDNTPKIKFNAGDDIKIDVAKGLIRLNGEVRTDLFAVETDLFSLVPGINIIGLSDNVEGEITFTNKYY